MAWEEIEMPENEFDKFKRTEIGHSTSWAGLYILYLSASSWQQSRTHRHQAESQRTGRIESRTEHV
jgi:hypothetical protein